MLKPIQEDREQLTVSVLNNLILCKTSGKNAKPQTFAGSFKRNQTDEVELRGSQAHPSLGTSLQAQLSWHFPAWRLETLFLPCVLPLSLLLLQTRTLETAHKSETKPEGKRTGNLAYKKGGCKMLISLPDGNCSFLESSGHGPPSTSPGDGLGSHLIWIFLKHSLQPPFFLTY